MQVMSKFLDALGDEAGLGERVLTDPAALAAFSCDALTVFNERPEAVAIPQTSAGAVAIVRACHRHGVPFVARGSGTSLSGGSVPVVGGIVIALNRLNRVLRVDPDQRLAVVETGTINLDVSRAALAHGLAYAPDPSSQAGLHDRRQPRLQFRRRPLPQARYDEQPRARADSGPARR
jgi:glycolate oxidase